MLDRIRQLIVYSGLTHSQFADSIEVPRAILSHIMSGRNKPSLDVIVKVIAKYKTIDVNWLLLGEGEMLKAIAEKEVPVKAENTTSNFVEEVVNNMIVSDDEPEKIQTKNIPLAPSSQATGSAKQVKQIVFFYTDNSFSVFNPEG